MVAGRGAVAEGEIAGNGQRAGRIRFFGCCETDEMFFGPCGAAARQDVPAAADVDASSVSDKDTDTWAAYLGGEEVQRHEAKGGKGAEDEQT